MKIINPSAVLIEDQLAALSIYQRIDSAASVCYQRDPRPSEEDAIKFCRSMVDRKHLATLEFAVVHLVVNTRLCDIPKSKYIQVEPCFPGKAVVTGSIRAFMECIDENSTINTFLWDRIQVFFPGPCWFDAGAVDLAVRFALPGEVPDSHKHVAVRFIVNRAVSHELVRHRPCSFLQESQRYVRYGDEVTFIEPEWYSKGDLERIWDRAMSDAEDSYQTMLRDGLSPQQARAVLPNSTKTELLVYTNLDEWKHIFNLRCSAAADPEMIRVMLPLREEFARRWPGVFGEV